LALIAISFFEGDRAATNGLIVGSLAGISFFLVAWWCVNVIVKDKRKEQTNPIMAVIALHVFVLKFPVLGVGLWFAFKYMEIKPSALILGIGITQIAILTAALNKLFKKH
jgi:hypothetical protein